MFGSIGLVRDRRDLQRSRTQKRQHVTMAANHPPVATEEDVLQQPMSTSPALQQPQAPAAMFWFQGQR
jgi:hypothetical protein